MGRRSFAKPVPSPKFKVILAIGGCVVLLAGAALVAKKLRHRHGGAPTTSAQGPHSARVAKPFDVADAVAVIYDGKLGDGWSDWGWGPHELPPSGPAKITFSGYGGIILQHASVQKPVSGLSFRFKAPAAWGEFLLVSLKLAGSQDSLFKSVAVDSRHLAPLPGGFQEALIPWSELNPSNVPFDRLVINAVTRVADEPVLLDKILLLRTNGATPQSDSRVAPVRPVDLDILCTADSHPISPLIYGSAGGDWDSKQGAERFGGNPTTRLNWDIKLWNTGNDWFFENGGGMDVAAWAETAASHKVRTAITVPMIGWVSKDGTSVGFPASKFPKQRKFDQNRPEAGDGSLPNGSPIAPGSPEQTSIPAPPELIGRWVRDLREKDRARGARNIDMYILDNEPTLWDTTHRDVHPDPVTYDELLDRTIRYGSEVRRADPDVKIAGPAEWGWLGYLYSGKDRADGKFVRSDRRAHGDEPLLAWYLKKLAQYEKDHGVRLLDVLDVHYYPASDGLYGANAKTDADAAALRVRATRSLWDPTYIDESWIQEPIRLIPRLKEWVAANYPGVGISIGEWSFGADAHISGGLATAETLGRFGQQGIYSAFYWQGPVKDSATFWAFRAFTNFDGAGGRFLEQSVATREASNVSLFASRDASGEHMVAVMVNRDPVFAATTSIDMGACGRVKSLRVFGYEAGASGLVERKPDATRSDKLVTTAPPYSITVLDAQLATTARAPQ